MCCALHYMSENCNYLNTLCSHYVWISTGYSYVLGVLASRWKEENLARCFEAKIECEKAGSHCRNQIQDTWLVQLVLWYNQITRKPPTLTILYIYYIVQVLLNASVAHLAATRSVCAIRTPLGLTGKLSLPGEKKHVEWFS